MSEFVCIHYTVMYTVILTNVNYQVSMLSLSLCFNFKISYIAG